MTITRFAFATSIHFGATHEWEHRQWQDAVTDWELKRYFEII